ncbi:hypothetical protein EVAR_41202_1 [Eumeta japonica]|uniref:Uncharacterized protein n=1 Tax=Eumeta variegata TaxID=151549 RepID=A0A4C1WTE6_EUMVA|nr:hypothetical protein EVAR_41202_1 [Eumeta japonica]
MHARLDLGIFCTESIRDSRCSTAIVKPAAKHLYISKTQYGYSRRDLVAATTQDVAHHLITMSRAMLRRRSRRAMAAFGTRAEGRDAAASRGGPARAPASSRKQLSSRRGEF